MFNIRDSFPEEINIELNRLNSRITKSELAKRRDFRNQTTFTIDPVDAKDFDDAISVKILTDKKVQIGIHIADVGHYVKPKSEIDKEAFLRAFSIYFPGKVVI